jgi:HAD superfamily hydrolase (TIGR01509 family)
MKRPAAAVFFAVWRSGRVMSELEKLVRPRALLFDMDGTLTRPLLDFDRIRAEIGLAPGQGILESIAEMAPPRQSEARAILERHEEAAARESTLNDGAIEILAWARQRRIGTALITRNSRQSAATVLGKHGLRLDCLVAREDGPIKPDPRPLLMACDRLGAKTESAWMIGDWLHDIAAANAAGIRSVWISHRQARTFAALPWKSVNDLIELMALLESAAPGDGAIGG